MSAPAPIDRAAFARDLDRLRASMEASLGPQDLAHLKKMIIWGKLCALFGYATAWIAPNPISAILIALANTARWAIVMHHVAHRGYDRVPDVPARYTSRGFARGVGRLRDWLDWIEPNAWRFEHNILHHGRTGELDDPDLLEENVAWFRSTKLPSPIKYLVIAFFACTWKLTYYAPSTFQVLRWQVRRKNRETTRAVREDIDRVKPFIPTTRVGRDFWPTILPYIIVRFLLLPFLFYPLGAWAMFSVFANSVLAELLANLHSFMIIVPNHAGGDLYRFDGHAEDKETYYYRQVVGTANYTSPNELTDFLQGGLNFQIEHHLFPDLPLSQYRRIQPELRAICERHGVPYIEENVFIRAGKLMDILMSRSSMRTEGSEPKCAPAPAPVRNSPQPELAAHL